MKKVYIITYEECSSGDFHSGVCYVFDTLEKAEKELEMIKQDEINYYYENIDENIENITHDLITEKGFIIDFIDDYTKYVIEEEIVR